MPDYKKAARRAAAKYGVDQGIFLAMIQQESGFNPNVTSPAGARGIAQFIPSTAKSYGVNLGDGRVTDDLEGAARYLRDNLKRTGGNYTKALSIYNSGRPDGYLSIPETKNYVRNIRAMSKRYGSDPSVKPSSGGNVSSQGDRTPQTQTKTTVTGAGFDPGPGASALAQLAQQQARPTVQTTVPTPPQFAASAAMPQGYQAPSAAPVQQQASGLTDLLSQIGAGGQSLPRVDVKTETSTGASGGQRRSSSGRPRGGSFGGGLVDMVRSTDALAGRIGVPVTAKQEPGHAPGGDHDPAVKGASARDYGGDEASRERLFRQITRRLGVKNAEYKGADINVVKNGVRWQIISRDHGTGPHLHVGWRKA